MCRHNQIPVGAKKKALLAVKEPFQLQVTPKVWRKRRSSACRVQLSSSIYVCVCSLMGWGRWVGKKVMLECRENGMFECRGNMGDARTEEGRNRSHLSMSPDHLSFCFL